MTPEVPGPIGSDRLLERARNALAGDGLLVVLTGAGMSAESGVPTFRDAQSGLWARFDPADLATPEAWNRDPERVWAWYRWRQRLVASAEPHAGHIAIARASTHREVVVVTQNVDDLHERAGSPEVHHLHGNLFAHHCESCGAAADIGDPPAEQVDRVPPAACAGCGSRVRPGVVWFGEMLPSRPWEAAVTSISRASAVLVVGTSGLVHPAASLPGLAAERGLPVVEVNPGDAGSAPEVTVHLRATAGETLPTLLHR